MKKVLESNYTLTPVSDLWEHTLLVFKHCPIPVSDDVIEQVFVLTHHEGLSLSIFLKVFAKEKKEYHVKKPPESVVTLEIVVNELWKPICAELKADLQNLHDGLKLPLKKVAYFFEGMSHLKEIEEELSKWCDAFEVTEKRWIKDAAQKISDYQELCRYSYTAKTLIQLKETLKLTGDFSAVEALLMPEVNYSK